MIDNEGGSEIIRRGKTRMEGLDCSPLVCVRVGRSASVMGLCERWGFPNLDCWLDMIGWLLFVLCAALGVLRERLNLLCLVSRLGEFVSHG